MGKVEALLLYRQLLKSLNNQVSREQVRKYYQYSVKQREEGSGGENKEMLKTIELYLRAIKTQNHIMDLDRIGIPKDNLEQAKKIATYVGLRMPYDDDQQNK